MKLVDELGDQAKAEKIDAVKILMAHVLIVFDKTVSSLRKKLN